MSDYFEKYGGKNPITEKNADPVQCCLEGSYLNCPENPWRFEKGLCQNFMGQRCARGWDKNCDLYLDQQSTADFTGKKANDFLFEAFTAKFCRDDTSDPTNKCYTRCEMMNPLADNSAVVCKTYGNNAYRDVKTLSAISTAYLQDAKLDSSSPISVHQCPKTCDILSLNDFEENNRLLNEVLDRGVAQNGVMNLAENIVKQGIQVKNTRLINFINKYIKQAGSAQPNQIDATLGKTNFKSIVPVPTPIASTIPENPIMKMTTEPERNTLPVNLQKSQVMKREGFRGETSGMSQQDMILYAIVIGIAGYLLFTSMCKK
jgi:hypothetical protein